MGLSEKLSYHFPGAQWSLNGDSYAGLVWYGPGDQPTEQEIDELPEPPATTYTAPYLYAVALLTVANGEVSGIDVASKFSAAFWLDVGTYYVFFNETLPDTSYLVKAYGNDAVMTIAEKTTDYILVLVKDQTGTPIDPTEINIEIIRVT